MMNIVLEIYFVHQLNVRFYIGYFNDVLAFSLNTFFVNKMDNIVIILFNTYEQEELIVKYVRHLVQL